MTQNFPESSNPWFAYLPDLHKALIGGADDVSLPNPYRLNALTEFCGYWECVFYLLDSLLGWEDQAKGLFSWCQAGKPTQDSPVLELLKKHWDRDDLLDFYCAWQWITGCAFSGPEDFSSSEMIGLSKYANEDWLRNFKRRERLMRHDPFYGGSNPLHLGYSRRFGIGDHCNDDDIDLYFSQKRKLQVVLVVKSIQSWKTELYRCSQFLPATMNERSWRVRVFDPLNGYLGEFRQSRETGKWFTGKHSIHMMGNTTPNEINK